MTVMDKPAFPLMIRNESVKSRIASDIIDRSLFHALLFTGAKGTGKRFFAYQTAAAMACENSHSTDLPLPCGECSSCRKILGGFCPDVIFISRDDKASIGVDIVRKLINDSVIAPHELDFKVFIIDGFDYLTAQAQNSTLKVFEEPPKDTYFILLAENVQNIIETVMSRVIRFDFEALSEKDIREYLDSYLKESPEIKNRNTELAVKMSKGSLGKALDMLSQEEPKFRETVESYNKAMIFYRMISESSDASECLYFLTGCSKDRSSLAELFTNISGASMDIISYKLETGKGYRYFLDEKDAADLSSRFSIRKLFRIAELADSKRDAVLGNSNISLTVNSFNIGLFDILSSN